MNPFFDRVFLYFALAVIAANCMAGAESTFGRVFWAIPLGLNLFLVGTSLHDWWTKYRGITDAGVKVADSGVLLKRKVRN